MPGNNSFLSVFFITGLSLGLCTLICGLLSLGICWIIGLEISGGVILVSVLTTLFVMAFLAAYFTPEGKELDGTSTDENFSVDEDEEETQEHSETSEDDTKENK
jgi:hypothetical protein